MLVRRVIQERREQLAHEALWGIEALRANWVLRERQEPPGPLDRLVLKAGKAFLDRWERQELSALKGQ